MCYYDISTFLADTTGVAVPPISSLFLPFRCVYMNYVYWIDDEYNDPRVPMSMLDGRPRSSSFRLAKGRSKGPRVVTTTWRRLYLSAQQCEVCRAPRATYGHDS